MCPSVIEAVRHRLIVSCQPVPGGPLDGADFVVAFALAALAGGAAGLRVEGRANVAAVRAATVVPIIGLIKRAEPGSDVYITPGVADVIGLAEAGAEIIAIDATRRPRHVPVRDLIAAIHGCGALAMADVADAGDAAEAVAAGADIVGTTLSGYTGGPVSDGPDLGLIARCATLGVPVFAEGRVKTPAQAADAIANGATAVVVGSAITRVEHITSWFAEAIAAAAAPP